jgi:hypothetical protein
MPSRPARCAVCTGRLAGASIRAIRVLEVTRQCLSKLFPMELVSESMISPVSMCALVEECPMFGIVKEDIQLRFIIKAESDVRHIGSQLAGSQQTAHRTGVV